MNNLILIILASILVSIFSFIGIFVVLMKKKNLQRTTLILVSLSAGALIGGAFFHLIPEASESLSIDKLFIFVLVGFILFFIIEKVLHWRHCHNGECDIHSFAHMSLFGDGIHNFIDGLIIASSFLVNYKIGIITTFAIIIHEVPQEFGDFGVLIHGGFTKKRALLFNFISGLIAVIGAVMGYFIFSNLNFDYSFLLAIAAGGFLYVSSSDLIPEIRKEMKIKKSLINISVFLLGLLMMYLLKFFGLS